MSSNIPVNFNNVIDNDNDNDMNDLNNIIKNNKTEWLDLSDHDSDDEYDEEKIQLRRDKEDEYLRQLEDKYEALGEQIASEKARINGRRKREDKKINNKKSIKKRKKRLDKLHEKNQERRYQVRKQIKRLQKQL